MFAVPYLTDVLKTLKIDIIALAEHWLHKSQFHFLDTIDNVNYKAYGKSVDEYHTNLYSCNARGGVALMVSKALCPYVTEIVIESNRLCGIEIKFSGEHSIFLIAVYLPVANTILRLVF